ncbi:indole-3-glycerol phosphate synthase TrpC [Clostridium neuense]|uniref:Indole-3-glycerol phosphate synthase n=1 Tax=Clostridium neuense TaxID=1728934 RepID=A0ABW8TE51_9CLOT
MILDEIVANKLKQLKEEKSIINEEKMQQLAYECDKPIRNFKAAINKEKISIIAEIKKASPSKGIILEEFDPCKIARLYEKIDINAISVLTERKYFLGKDEYINKVKEISTKPVLRKDFIVDKYQLYQARAIGADAVLLIAAVLKDKLQDFYKKALELGLHSITEVHNEKDVKLAVEAGCSVIGINNRDLRDFSTDLRTTEKLLKYVPKETVTVSESAIKTAEDIKYVASLGVSAVLIGEAFMRNINKKAYISQFLEEAKKM